MGWNCTREIYLEQCDKEVIDSLSKYPNLIGEKIEKYKFKEGLQELMNLARLGNKYLADTEPWKLKKTDEKTFAIFLQARKSILKVILISSQDSFLSHRLN